MNTESNNIKGVFYGVGLGPGDPELVTLKALKLMQRADIIYTAVSRQGSTSVSGRIVAALPDIQAECRELVFAMNQDWNDRQKVISNHAHTIAGELDQGRNCVFATIGDPLTYSTCGYLSSMLERIIPEAGQVIVPGVNSWSAAAAEYGKAPLVEDMERLTVIPGYLEPDKAEIARCLAENGTTVFLKTYRTRNCIINALKDFPADIIYGADIGLDSQFVSDNIEEIIKRKDEYLSMLIVKPKLYPRENK